MWIQTLKNPDKLEVTMVILQQEKKKIENAVKEFSILFLAKKKWMNVTNNLHLTREPCN